MKNLKMMVVTTIIRDGEFLDINVHDEGIGDLAMRSMSNKIHEVIGELLEELSVPLDRHEAQE